MENVLYFQAKNNEIGLNLKEYKTNKFKAVTADDTSYRIKKEE